MTQNNLIKSKLELIKKKNWYKQGVEAIPWFLEVPYDAAMFEWGLENVFVIWFGTHNEAYFDFDFETKRAKNTVLKSEKDPDYLKKKYIMPWLKIGTQIDKKLLIVDKGLKKIPDKKLLSLNMEIISSMSRLWRPAVIIENFDPAGNIIFEEAEKRHNISMSKEDKDIIQLPAINTFMTDEFFDRLLITESIVKLLGRDCNINQIVKDKKTRQLIKEHTQKYFWIENSWAEGKYISELEFTKKIIDDLQNLDALKRKRQEIIDRIKFVKQAKSRILKDMQSKEMKNICKLYEQLADFREIRKRRVLKDHYYLYELLKETCRRSKTPISTLQWSFPSEIKSLKIDKNLLKELEQRKTKYIVTGLKNKLIHVYGKDVDTISNALIKRLNTSEIKGVVANKGIVKGYAKIVLKKDDFKKVNKGDIIVAMMTRPDYMPIMEKASAIITDEGGTTCHAAIVARELKKPCIVGTQTATILLKDGDYIEVDAEKGIVKKIK